MFLRFKNRFSRGLTEIYPCRCGVNFSRSVEGTRETFLHEEPWCEPFRELVAKLEREAGTSLQVGKITDLEGLVVLGEGKTQAEVRELAARFGKERWS